MELSRLDKYIIEDITSNDHPSDFIKRDEFLVLVLRLPEVENGVKIKSYAYILEGENVYCVNQNKLSLNKIGTVNDLFAILNDKVEKLIDSVKKYHINIDKLEDSIYNNNIKNDFMHEWLSYKQEVSLINRLMFHASIALEQFFNSIKKNSNLTYDTLAVEDITEELKRVQDLSKSAIEKLDNLYNFYRAKVDEKMNKNMYYLTMLSGIFLPLTLLTGFFGMNTGGLPYTEDSMGTWKVVILAVILEVIFLLPFFIQNFKKVKRVKK